MKLKIIENFFDENDLQEIKSTKLENVTKDKINNLELEILIFFINIYKLKN